MTLNMLIILCMISMLLISYPVIASLETYIVHVKLPKNLARNDPDKLHAFYWAYLPESTRLVHSYRHVATGFAANLSPEEVKEIQKMGGFISARPQKKLSLHTTHSANFLGLYQNSGVWLGTNYGQGVIIGLLDTGIAPAHLSFDDKDMPSPPPKWKGKCDFNGGPTCNNKLIGARNFVTGIPGPPLDDAGHGTHTSSTAAGVFVGPANVFGMANGTAAGMAPRAHIAMYKVCTEEGCSEADILAAMDAAIDDGVDVLSLSLGGPPAEFYADGIAIGAFAAIQKGIFVSCSAGNSGPFSSSLSNEAPWILTVGASTTDRKIMANPILGLGYGYLGESLFQPSTGPLTPLVDAGAGGNSTAALCGPGSLDSTDVKGKVVLCVRGGSIGRIAKGQTVKDAGGAAMILMNDEINGYSTLVDAHVLPASHVSFHAGDSIRAYINSSTAANANATIEFLGTVVGEPNSPAVTSFSSRGPSIESPGILKPDIIGPGVSILAAWPVSIDNYTHETATFNVISGTSMSCPHLSGIAALLKSAHPEWSPAAIKSAIMTSATRLNLRGDPIADERNLRANIFATGAGHVNPAGANDPGLVYDLQPVDYIPYLCGLGYTDGQVEMIVGQPVSCSKVRGIPEAQLNYPSFSVEVGAGGVESYTRTVTNVGEAESSYSASVVYHAEDGVGVVALVEPDTLSFSQVNQKMTYQVSFSKANSNVTYVEGEIQWRSSNRTVRTPFYVQVAGN